jgi:hypothetical protein
MPHDEHVAMLGHGAAVWNEWRADHDDTPDGIVKLNNHDEKFVGIDVWITAQSLPRTQPSLVRKT